MTQDKAALVPRRYQDAAVRACWDYWRSAKGQWPIVIAPTGCGKSFMIAMIIRELAEKRPGVGVLMMARRAELIEQNVTELHQYAPEIPINVYSASLRSKEVGGLTAAQVQSFVNLDPRDYPPNIRLVIIDEAHQVPTTGDGQYATVIERLRKQSGEDLRGLGLTATAYRMDSGPLEEGRRRIFDGVAYEITIAELLREKVLAPPVSTEAREAIELKSVSRRNGEYHAGDLDRETIGKSDRIANEIVRKCSKRHKWIVFCAGVEGAIEIGRKIRDRGIETAVVTDQNNQRERRTMLNRFRDRRSGLRCLVNVGILTEGFNAPYTDAVVLLRATMSTSLYVQMVGRGMRTAEGKRNCLVVDFGGNVFRHGPIDDVIVNTTGGSAKKERTAQAQDLPEVPIAHAQLGVPVQDLQQPLPAARTRRRGVRQAGRECRNGEDHRGRTA